MQGGVGDYTCEIALALRDLGCSVQVVSSTRAGPVPGLTVHPVITGWGWGCWRILLDLVREERPEVVHIQYQAAAYAMHPAINFLPRRLHGLGPLRPRVVTTFHDLRVPFLFPKAGPLRRAVVEELARQADRTITTNREDYENLKHTLPAPPALIPIGSNIKPQLPAEYDRIAWRARWGVGQRISCFVSLGLSMSAKEWARCCKHWMSLVNRRNGSLPAECNSVVRPQLVMIGGHTGASDPTNVLYLGKVRALITEMGLERCVHWTGFVPAEEVTATFLSSDLCVLPFEDGVSFLHGTFHAALAHGIPIVTTHPNIPLPELVDGENVLLVPTGQPQALADAVCRLATDASLRRSLADGAKALSEQFTWPRIASETLQLYQSLC